MRKPTYLSDRRHWAPKLASYIMLHLVELHVWVSVFPTATLSFLALVALLCNADHPIITYRILRYPSHTF